MQNEIMVIEENMSVKVVYNSAMKYYKDMGNVICIKKLRPYIKKEMDRAVMKEFNIQNPENRIESPSDVTKRMRDQVSFKTKITAKDASLILSKTLSICHFDNKGNMVLDPQKYIPKLVGGQK